MSIKHKILVCSGAGEPEHTTSKSFIRALNRTNNEVMTCGAMYRYNDIKKADIDVEDKAFPETYTYKEILEKCKPFEPDTIIQIEPHFYLIGDKPANICSYYWILDAHRGGYAYRNLAEQGSFDAIFLAQKFFAPSYNRNAQNAYCLPQAFDKERIKYDADIKPECDIAFIGETGIADLTYDKIDNDELLYTNTIKDDFQLLSPKYREYAERAHLLKRLCRDFDVRIYKKDFFANYSRIIQKGRVAFHRSLFNDIALRLFEILACKRALVCDYVPYLEEILQSGKHCLAYRTFGFNYELENFELDYEQTHNAVKKLLCDDKLRSQIAEDAYQYVHKYHTFDNRAEDMLKVIDNCAGQKTSSV